MTGIDLHRLLHQYPFESVLWIGAAAPIKPIDLDIKIEYRDAVQVLPPGTVEGRWDLVILDVGMLQLPRNQLIRAISNFRDLHARRLLVLFSEPPPADIEIRHADLISLGLRALKGQPSVFYHDLYDYKQTPDWLNDRYWANPENWDKYRW